MKWCESTLKPSDGQEIIARARDGVGNRWHYQIGVWIDGEFQNPTMGCDMCGGKARFLPVARGNAHPDRSRSGGNRMGCGLRPKHRRR